MTTDPIAGVCRKCSFGINILVGIFVDQHILGRNIFGQHICCYVFWYKYVLVEICLAGIFVDMFVVIIMGMCVCRRRVSG